jgi:hypothetical protein
MIISDRTRVSRPGNGGSKNDGSDGGRRGRSLYIEGSASDRLSISAMLTEAVAKMLRDGLEPRLLQNTPGVGLEPTTSRLTVERICQLSYPGSSCPGITGPAAL